MRIRSPMTMPSLTFLDKTSILIPRSKAFLTRPRYCLPFLCRDKEWRNDAFHELVSGYVCHNGISYTESPLCQMRKVYENVLKYTLRTLATRDRPRGIPRRGTIGKPLDAFRPLPPRAPRA